MTRLPPWLTVAAFAGANLVLAFLVLPIFAVVPASFNQSSFIALPPNDYSLRWYEAFFEDAGWRNSLWVSVKAAVLTTVFTLAVGIPAAMGMQRIPSRARTLLMAVFLAPIIVPVIVIAIAVYRTALDIGLNGTLAGLVLSHSSLALPFVVINVGISLAAIDDRWLQAAAGLGATPWTVFRTITLPNILPGVVGGAVFAFVTSFDEAIVSIFMAGYAAKTLPVKMWETIRIEFTPAVAVAATLMIVLAAVLFVVGRWIGPSPERAAR